MSNSSAICLNVFRCRCSLHNVHNNNYNNFAPNIKFYRPTFGLFGNVISLQCCMRTVIDLCISCVLTTFNKEEEEDDDDDDD